ncbi:MAG: hypothetical protein FWD70_05305 [Desulfuromonadales bacterium]|nr:hypothetical protein [Desulfuromonadales bacterium]
MKYTLFIKFFVICVLFCSLSACNDSRHHAVNFYYWRHIGSVGAVEKEYFQKLESRKMYLRLFDVDKSDSGEPQPMAELRNFNPEVLHADYIPVVFITNRTFVGLSQADIKRLVGNVNYLINSTLMANNIKGGNEIQIDCDWTVSTKSQYFMFLKELGACSGKQISCTIRLHQIKFSSSTGIPPVSKGYLMCYATSSPLEGMERNSILDIPTLKSYLRSVNSYPLAFDIALPIFSWGIVTNHLGRMKLINGVTEDMMDSERFEKIGTNLYRAKDDFFFKGLYINRDFSVKIEFISSNLLHDARMFLDKKIKADYDIVYFHLDEQFLKRFRIEDLR